jgi:hypothetical protein
MNYQYSQQPYMHDTTEATASYGRFKTYMSSFMICSFILSLCCLGGFILNIGLKPPTNTTKTSGVIISMNNGYTVRYTVNNRNYENIIRLNTIPYIGKTIDLYYNNDNPNIINEAISKMTSIGYGIGIMCFALCIFIIMSMNLYSVHKYKTAAINSALTPTGSSSYGYRNRGFTPTIVI